MGLSCAILEDSPNSSRLLESYIYKMPTLQMNGVYQDFDSLEMALSKESIAILFIVFSKKDDIAYNYLKKLPQSISLILHSSDTALAIDAYQIQAVDFLTMPIQVDLLRDAIQKAIMARVMNLNEQNKLENILKKKYFFIKSDYKIVKITINEILFVEGLGEYIRIHTTQNKIVTLLALSKLLEILPNYQFISIHRSYIINIDKINFIQNNIVSIGANQLPISKSRKKIFLNFINSSGLL